MRSNKHHSRRATAVSETCQPARAFCPPNPNSGAQQMMPQTRMSHVPWDVCPTPSRLAMPIQPCVGSPSHPLARTLTGSTHSPVEDRRQAGSCQPSFGSGVARRAARRCQISSTDGRSTFDLGCPRAGGHSHHGKISTWWCSSRRPRTEAKPSRLARWARDEATRKINVQNAQALDDANPGRLGKLGSAARG